MTGRKEESNIWTRKKYRKLNKKVDLQRRIKERDNNKTGKYS